jgi:hypothetical protein
MSSPRYINVSLERSPVGLGLRKAAQWVNASDFTDNEDTTASLTMTPTLPEGAFVIGTKVKITSAFDDDTTCVMTVGKSDGEDEFSDGTTLDIASADVVGDTAEDVLEYLAAETSIYLKFTSGTDATDVIAGDGKMLVEVFYLSTELELDESYPLKTAEQV